MYVHTVWYENIGGEVNLEDWWMYERTTKFNSTNDVYTLERSASLNWSTKL